MRQTVRKPLAKSWCGHVDVLVEIAVMASWHDTLMPNSYAYSSWSGFKKLQTTYRALVQPGYARAIELQASQGTVEGRRMLVNIDCDYMITRRV